MLLNILFAIATTVVGGALGYHFAPGSPGAVAEGAIGGMMLAFLLIEFAFAPD